jgi:hypothetical protein
MKKGILTILAYFVMCGVSYASDVYITQSGASLTANINQDGQTNKFGDATTDVTLTGDNQTLDIDQVGSTNTIAASVVGATQELTINQTGSNNTSTVSVGSNSASADNSIIQLMMQMLILWPQVTAILLQSMKIVQRQCCLQTRR